MSYLAYNALHDHNYYMFKTQQDDGLVVLVKLLDMHVSCAHGWLDVYVQPPGTVLRLWEYVL